MIAGQNLFLNKLVILDTEVNNHVIGYSRINDLCITTIFGDTIFRCYNIDATEANNIFDVIRNKVVVAFDSNQDATFLTKELKILSINSENINWFCAKKFLEKFFLIDNLSLKKACSIVKLKYPKHNALSDCIALARVFRKVLKIMPDSYNEQYVDLVLAILQAYKENGMDLLPLGDNLPLDYLINEIEGRTSLGTHYLELIRNQVLDELTNRGAFSTNVDILKRNDDLNNVT